MIRKQFLAAALLLTMLFSLSACSFFSGKTPAAPMPESVVDNAKAEQDDYTLAVDALQAFLDEPGDARYALLTGGSLAREEAEAFISAYEVFYAQEADSFSAALREDVGGGSIQSHEDFPLDENALKRSRSELERFCRSLEASIDASRNEMESMSDEAWKANAGQQGISPEQLRKNTEALIDAMEELLDALEDVQIEQVHTVRITLSGANSAVRDVTIFFADGKWFTADLLDYPI